MTKLLGSFHILCAQRSQPPLKCGISREISTERREHVVGLLNDIAGIRRKMQLLPKQIFLIKLNVRSNCMTVSACKKWDITVRDVLIMKCRKKRIKNIATKRIPNFTLDTLCESYVNSVFFYFEFGLWRTRAEFSVTESVMQSRRNKEMNSDRPTKKSSSMSSSLQLF